MTYVETIGRISDLLMECATRGADQALQAGAEDSDIYALRACVRQAILDRANEFLDLGLESAVQYVLEYRRFRSGEGACPQTN